MKINPWLLALVVAPIVVIAVLTGIIVYRTIGSSGVTLSDVMNVIYTLFTGFGLLGVVLTLMASQEQLNLQRSQIASSGEDIERQQRMLERQAEFNTQQAIRSEFFQILSSWQDVVESTQHTLDFRGNGTFPEGRVALQDFSTRIKKAVHANYSFGAGAGGRERGVQEVFEGESSRYGLDLNHYFRLLYNLIRFVAESPLGNEQKTSLLRLARAHVSRSEFVLIFYNAIRPEGEHLRPLLDKWDFLQNMAEEDVADPEDMRFFPETAKRWQAEGRTVPERARL